MKLKVFTLRVPRAHAELVVDILECNDLTCLVDAPPDVEDRLIEGPRLLHVVIPEDVLEDHEIEACDECGEAILPDGHDHGPKKPDPAN